MVGYLTRSLWGETRRFQRSIWWSEQFNTRFYYSLSVKLNTARDWVCNIMVLVVVDENDTNDIRECSMRAWSRVRNEYIVYTHLPYATRSYPACATGELFSSHHLRSKYVHEHKFRKKCFPISSANTDYPFSAEPREAITLSGKLGKKKAKKKSSMDENFPTSTE